MKRVTATLVLTLLMGILFYAAITIAQPSGPESINTIQSQRGNVTNSAVSVTAQAGNVTELDITATQITTAWQGFYGNISGNIVLQDSSGNNFYNWSGLGAISGEVYASRNDSVVWGSIGCINDTEISSENTYLGKTTADPDDITNTFNTSSHPEFDVGTTTISSNACNSTNAFINTGQSATDFYQVLLADGSSNIVYTTLIDEDQTGFDGTANDFQLLVGENGNATQAATLTPYFFYIELS